jgi:hypothetical protein
MSALRRTSSMYTLNVATELYLFDTYILPIISCGCEIWGMSKSLNIERFHLKFCKTITRRQYGNYRLHGLQWTEPLHNQRCVRIIKYWLKVLHTDNCIIHEMYRYQYRNLWHKNWVTSVKSLLDNIGLSCVWCNQHVTNGLAFIADVTERIKCVFLLENCTIMNSSNKCFIYKYLTDNVCLQFYLCTIVDRTIRS